MPWVVHEPMGYEARVTWLRTQRGNFDLGAELAMGIFSKDESEVLGCAGLIRGDVDERELGYWVHVAHEGKGLATEVASALVRVGFVIEALQTIEIRCLPDNEKSSRIPKKMGFSGPYRDPLSFPTADGDKRDIDSYTLSRVEYAQSPARKAAIEAYDVLDRRLL